VWGGAVRCCGVSRRKRAQGPPQFKELPHCQPIARISCVTLNHMKSASPLKVRPVAVRPATRRLPNRDALIRKLPKTPDSGRILEQDRS